MARERGSPRAASTMWARAELRARWRSWVVLGVLVGVTVGLAAAGVAGARRSESAVQGYADASGGIFDAAVLPNDPEFDAEARAQVAALPEVRETLPFAVPFFVEATEPAIGGSLLPLTGPTARLNEGYLVEGRHTNPRRADEVVIDENVARRHDLGLGSTVVIVQRLPPLAPGEELPPGITPANPRNFTERLRVVGIGKSVSDESNWSPSAALLREHQDEVVGVTNMFVRLRHGARDFVRFQAGVQRVLGHPVNVERGTELLGIEKTNAVIGVERDGLLLFALAVLLGGGVLVGQALVRAVNAAGAEFETWRAMGADRPLAVRGMVLPALVTTVVGAAVAVALAIALSPRFPIGVARRYDIDVGVHADWLVLAGALVLLGVAVLGAAGAAAWWRVTRGERQTSPTSRTARWANRIGLPPAALIGSRLAVEPGRGRRAVPVRSALIGAIVGVLGVVACFTFRAGISDAAVNPQRSGIVWDFLVAAGPGTVAPEDRATIVDDRAVGAATRALWARAIPVDGTPTSMFGIDPLEGSMPFVVLAGHAPRDASEIAVAPATMQALGLRIGDRIELGETRREVRVVGSALVPSSSHTSYDQGALVTLGGMRAALGPGGVQARPEDFEDYLLLRWKPNADVTAAERRVSKVGGGEYFADQATLPGAVVELGHLRTMPLILAIFFALLACATVAHALVTTVRRRRYDLAVLRSIGFTRHQSRLAIAWQATILAVLGLVVGIPLGLAVGRVVWRWVAEDFPVVYVPPIEVLAVLVIVPVALLLAQLLAAGPAHAATRIRPAETLRTE